VHLECSGVLTPTAATERSLELRQNLTTDTHRNCVREEEIVKLVLRGNSLAMTSIRTPRATLYRRSEEKEPQPPKAREQPQPPTSKENAIQRY
jgi:hypothetical protein